MRLSRPRESLPTSTPSLIAQLMGAELASRRSSALGGSSLGRVPRTFGQMRLQGARGRLNVRSEADVLSSGGRMPALDPTDFSSIPLPPHPLLHRGQLANGLRYVVLPNAKPPSRFEAHLEIHAGSVDEEEDEQGLAHLVEHVVYMGSRKRERLLGTPRGWLILTAPSPLRLGARLFKPGLRLGAIQLGNPQYLWDHSPLRCARRG